MTGIEIIMFSSLRDTCDEFQRLTRMRAYAPARGMARGLLRARAHERGNRGTRHMCHGTVNSLKIH